MAFSKFFRIIFSLLAGISLLVVLFFYVGPKSVNYDQLEMRVEEALNPVDLTPAAPLPTVDTTAQDSASVEPVAAVEATNQGGTLTEAELAIAAGVNLREHLTVWEYLVWFRTDIALIWAYVLVMITLAASIVFPLIAVFTNRKGLIRLLAVLGGAAVLLVISYLLSKDTPINIIGYTGTDNSDPSTLKMIDTGLFITYMLFGLGIASILYAVISKAFK